jgi:N-acetyltransferase
MSGNGFHPPVTLRGRWVTLVPLALDHVPALARAGRDPEIWQYLRIGPGRTKEEMTALVEHHLAEQEVGAVLAFTILVRPDDRAAGIVRYLEIDRENEAVEVGTWLTSALWRSPINTEVKLLTMRYAFEEEKVHRFQLKTDVRNERSQRAIDRLGARREGTLREHILRPDGAYRSSIYYSILAPEWPAVRDRLEEMLARPWSGLPERPIPWWA